MLDLQLKKQGLWRCGKAFTSSWESVNKVHTMYFPWLPACFQLLDLILYPLVYSSCPYTPGGLPSSVIFDKSLECAAIRPSLVGKSAMAPTGPVLPSLLWLRKKWL